MSAGDLDDLLSRMSEIATAVNGFTSEAIQQQAFVALIGAYTGKHHVPPLVPAVSENPPRPLTQEHVAEEDPLPRPRNGGDSRPKKLKKSSGETLRLVRELDIHPSGKQSFEEFAAEKKPKSNEDKYAVAVYWLKHVAEVPNVSYHHVHTVFRFLKWREPGDLIAGLRVTSSRKGTLDTANLEDIQTTPRGRNFVEHDLPAPEKAKN